MLPCLSAPTGLPEPLPTNRTLVARGDEGDDPPGSALDSLFCSDEHVGAGQLERDKESFL